jgi:hypothetical protein
MGVEKDLQVHGHRSPRLIKWKEKIHHPSPRYLLRIGQNLTRGPLDSVSSLITIEPLLPSMSPDQRRLQRFPKSQRRNQK